MIFPPECKYVGSAATQPYKNKVYFLTKYLIHPVTEGFEILEVELGNEKSMLRSIVSTHKIVGAEDVAFWDDDIIKTLHDRAGLIQKAKKTGKRCTIFKAEDEHMTFILDPDLADFETIHVYDIKPPRPNLSVMIQNLEELGLFEEQKVIFEHHIKDISKLNVDVYPCRAGGFKKTIDRDKLTSGEHIACCLTGRQICNECLKETLTFEDTCPLSMVSEEPFIARCCRIERCGKGIWNGKFGIVVHWGSSSRDMLNAIDSLLLEWHKHNQ